MTLGPDQPVFVAGHAGLAGRAIVGALARRGFSNVLTVPHAALDLTDASAVSAWFGQNRPAAVVLAAARVGGILANATLPVPFLLDNLRIQNNVIAAAHDAGVEHLVFLGSSCIYPRDAAQPLSESVLLTGPLEPTNRPYAIAKIAGIELCWALNRQFGRRYLCLMPTNLYGPGDNFDLASAHVLPALMRRMHEAHLGAREAVDLWGTGTPRREFLYSDDLGDAVAFVLTGGGTEDWFDESAPPLVNVGVGRDLSIAELATRIASVTGFEGAVRWDTSRPDGTPQKRLDVSRLERAGWRATTSLDAGLDRTFAAYLQGDGRGLS